MMREVSHVCNRCSPIESLCSVSCEDLARQLTKPFPLWGLSYAHFFLNHKMHSMFSMADKRFNSLKNWHMAQNINLALLTYYEQRKSKL